MSTLSRIALLPVSASLLLTLAGCSAGVESETPPPGGPAVTPPVVTEPTKPPAKPFDIAWASCSIPSERGKTIEAECATVDAPARRDVPGSGTTEVAVYRLKSKKQPATAQVWLLNGGPGGSGFSLAPYAQMFTTMAQGIDAYLIDHRGTGESAFLECPAAMATATTTEGYAEECSKEVRAAFGDRVDGFSTTESAYDVKELIESTAKPDDKVFVYGVSYGSYWAHRFLQIPNVRVDAMVTDGNCIGSTCTFDVPQTFGMDETMSFVFDACKENAACSAHLGADPFAFAAATIEKLGTGHCSAAKLSKMPAADLALSVGPYWPEGLPAIYYRLDRCNADDVTALNKLSSVVADINGGRMIKTLPNLGPTPRPSDGHNFSNTLLVHVIASEMVSKPAPTKAQLEAKASALTFKPGTDSFDLAYFDAWQGYPKSDLVGGWVNRDVPWLMLQGTFDFQTVFSLSTEALKHVQDPSLQRIRVDGGGHSVAFSTKCSLSIMESFLADPRGAKLDTSCLAEVKRTALDLEPAYVEYFFGTPNAWD